MKTYPISFILAFLCVAFCSNNYAQSFGVTASAVWITDCNQSNFFNTSGSAVNLIGPLANAFDNANLGVHTQNSETLIFRGAQVKTFKTTALSNVCNVRMYYRLYLQTNAPGPFTSIDLPLLENCNFPPGQFPSGDNCQSGDQKWKRVIADGQTTPYAPVDLTKNAPGKYVLEVYYEASGSFTTSTACDDIVTLNNTGANYKSSFTIQAPTIIGTNPSTCNGNEGSITISGLAAGGLYQLSYSDDVTTVGPAPFVASPAGQIIITGLNAGLYSDFVLNINGCETSLYTGIILSDPVFIARFTPIPPFCAGTATPVLASTSNNGITGIWNPAVIDNENSGTYVFTPTAGQCALPVSFRVNVIPRTTPVFSFGTGLIICGVGAVPTLPNTSTNGITGSWSPSVVDDKHSGTYVFTPTPGQCATGTSFTVVVDPVITPVFGFGTSSTICADGSVPILPTTSDNGITGSWMPAIADNQNSGTYIFTPAPGQCATQTTFSVTVKPILTPAFAFGATSSTCTGGNVPLLPAISTNGITGSWSPAVVDNQNSATYTFTPNAGECATGATFTVTVDPKVTPTFAFGTNLTICAEAGVPALPTTSTNGISGTWNPSVVDNVNPGTYAFTPNTTQCATGMSFTVTVVPLVTPTFPFGASSTICEGGSVPVLSTTSQNGITGTWNPAVVDNVNSGTYTFTPGAGQCARAATFNLSVTVNVIPTFSLGTTLKICAGEPVPALPAISDNGISGSWSPAVINNQVSGTYTFTASSGQCVTPYTFSVTVNPVVTPAFSFGDFQSVCIGAAVPVLTLTADNGVTGGWSPAVVDNQTNGVYRFTPGIGQCAVGSTFTLEVNPIPALTARRDTTVYDGAMLPEVNFITTGGAVSNWTNSNSSIGLAASGVGKMPSFIAVNRTDYPVTGSIKATPSVKGCSGAAQTYVITVLPLNKDVFVPNVFSPNGDGKNDVLYVYGNYIDKVEMRIFNQWGQQITMISEKSKGWDGRHNGTPQPVGVYVYVCKVITVDGRTVNLKGSITLIR